MNTGENNFKQHNRVGVYNPANVEAAKITSDQWGEHNIGIQQLDPGMQGATGNSLYPLIGSVR
ncbi:hypothetical protein EYZ11_003631 [Aspergillus tanneri]|uniref:Uncharacterized protein n=1 Tax=Aspergillus tanneri TaxID=1220188 RepID=A0A4V3UPY2_9EURO|nr:hypothetical protein EYZ11_003631 [Aspergillus tanneri]